jgi:hypothetical protein
VETPGCSALFVAIAAACEMPRDELQNVAAGLSSHA